MIQLKEIKTYLLGTVLLLFCACKQSRYTKLKMSQTNISFTNNITETDSINSYTFPHIYYGAGVAIGDINNDSLPDIYFSGNQVASKLYLNQGNFNFKDITKNANIMGELWETGVSILDINQDGWQDIYVSVSGNGAKEKRANKLYINNGDLTFTESAQAYGLAEQRQVIQSVFLDYDNDGDLDIFMLVNPSDYNSHTINSIKPKKIHGESPSTDILYRNNGDLTYTDVSVNAGILIEGYGLGVAVSDINKDGWPDLYISNDFLSNDVLYINQRNGTFRNQAKSYLSHTSFAGMGNDIADINNDALPDILELDMLPEDNFREKMILPGNNHKKFNMMIQRGYEPQYSRNTLQINNGNGTFRETGFISGVSSTDWSWAPLLADYDNDGDRDLYITNGYARDMGNLDFVNYGKSDVVSFGTENSRRTKYLESVASLKSVSIPNYMYKNRNGLQFIKQTNEWGLNHSSISSGAAYGDLDNDGDLDLVVSNINQPAFVYKNNTRSKEGGHSVKIYLKGPKHNLQGIGAKITLTSKGASQYYEHYLTRGYMSSVDAAIHFGLGNTSTIEKLHIIWPDGKTQTVKNIDADIKLTLSHEDAAVPNKIDDKANTNRMLFETDTDSTLTYVHKENNYIDFNTQPLIPHMHSANGPGISVGDINNDGYEDFYIGGAAESAGAIFMQQTNGQFIKMSFNEDIASEDMGTLLFDADNDNDLDMYIVSGGSAYPFGDKNYQDRFYINDGNGKYTKSQNALPTIDASGSCVVGADYDKDGDIDLFIGGRVSPGIYPTIPESYLLKNESKNNTVQFKKVNETGSHIGMVTDALWTDFNNDGWVDLFIVGEFMPLTLYKNYHGKLKKVEAPIGLENTNGWWNSINAGDFDKDGDIDYIVGNLGLNSRYTASVEQPLSIYSKDFDNNGTIDPILCRYILGINYISHSRNDLIKQINAMRNRFKTYQSYAESRFEEAFLEEELKDAQVLKSQLFTHSYIENLGKEQFKISALPIETQVAPVYGIQTNDYDSDGHLDILMTGNSFATEVSTGRYDAIDGLILKGNGKGHFKVLKSDVTGFFRPGDAKGIATIPIGKNLHILSATNNDTLKSFKLNKKKKWINIKPNDAYAIITTKTGRTYIKEFYYGNGYLSSASRLMDIPSDSKKIVITNTKNEQRVVPLNIVK